MITNAIIPIHTCFFHGDLSFFYFFHLYFYP